LKLCFFAVAVIALATTTAPLCRADPVVLNGSFEDPVIAPATSQAGGGTSWTTSGPNVFILSNNFGGPVTPFGDQYLGIASPGSSDQQSIPGFVTGQNYILDLFIANIFNSQNPKLTATITGAATVTGTFNATSTFQEVQLPFAATANGNITLSLIDSGAANIAADNVTIETLPEASTVFAMLLVSGTLTLGAVRRIRRSRAR
jgi:hypothetical protein